jgi:iron complex transport system substrate-binding protein
MKRIKRSLAVATVSLLVLASCGGDSDGTAAPADSVDTIDTIDNMATADTATAGDQGATTSASATTLGSDDGFGSDPTLIPQRIVSLSPTATEMLFAIGAGDQVIAVDDQSNYPSEAAAKSTALSGFEPNVEAIASYEPDLVVHDGTTSLGDALATLGISHWIGAAATSFDDIYTQIEQLGAATGHVAEAAELASTMQADLDAAVASVATPDVPLSFYHELDPTLYSVNSNTFIGQVYGLFGLRNVADTAEGGSDYPQLSAEFLISQSPDLIFLADTICCGETPETVVARPGWDAITAVSNGNVIALDDDTASRWGPRVVELVEAIAAGVGAASVAAG